jgi:subtilase family serine protease/subtilisin family serine protease
MSAKQKATARFSAIVLALAVVVYAGRNSGLLPGYPSQSATQHDVQLKGAPNTVLYVADELLVRFKDRVPENAIAAAHARVRASVKKKFSIVKNLQLVKLPQNVSVKAAIELYRRNPDVLHAEPNYLVKADTVPNDPSFASLWGLQNTGQTGGTPGADIHATAAWDLSQGSSSVVVAVIDTGIDYTHPDLAANVWSNPLDCNGNGIDDDGNGYIDDCHGIDVVNIDSDPMDDHNHGTHVSGTIGAVGNNGVGVVGVNWNVSIMACKFLSAAGSGSIAGAIECLQYVQMMKDRGVNIVATSNSWSGGGFSQSMYDAIDAHRQRGILFIAAAGNSTADNDATPAYPASYYLPNIIAVAATTKTDGLASFSNFGRRSVHLGAPGTEILSTTIGNTYSTFNGTSMATPHVTGVAALLKAQDPTRDWRAIKNLILAGGDNVSSLSRTVTQRRLNAYGAMTCAGSTVFSRLRPVENNLTGAVGTTFDLAALSISCANSNGTVNVVVQPGNQVVTLADDGLGIDQAAGDGICSGRWMPSAEGNYTLTFPDGDAVTAQVLSNYSSSTTAFNWRTIAGTSLNLGDDSSAQITPPFPVLFGDGSFTTLFVSSNGNVNFTAPFTEFSNDAIPTPQSATLVAPFWDDLVPAPDTAQNVFWDVTGAAPNRELVIEWRDVPQYSCNSADTVKFQVVFFEGSSDILFNYADVVFGGGCQSDLGGSATVGVQVASNVGNQFSFNAPSLANNTALLWSTSNATADLMLSAFSAPVASGAGLSLVITDTTKNQGSNSAGASTTKFYLSADNILDAGDIPLGSRAVPILAANVSSSGSTSVTIPAATTAGLYYIIAKADADNVVAEINEGNNSAYRSIQIGPDLIISYLSAPSAGGAGSAILVNDTTWNQGAGTADVSTTRFYLSTNSTLDAADVALGSRGVPSLAAGASSSAATSLVIPPGTATGSYYILAMADADNVVAETSESNNSGPYAFIQIGPDLVVSTLGAPSTAGSGLPLSIAETTMNQGAGTAAASATKFYLSTDTVWDAGDALLGGRSVPALNAGGASSASTSVTIPSSIVTGSYYILARADADGAVPEINENNNTQYTPVLIGPDLVISAFSAPSTGGAGATILVSDTTRNQGGGSAGASTTKFYLSTNTTLDSADVLLGGRAIPPLAAATTNSGSTWLSIPAGTATGSYYILAKADADNVVPETTENNNDTQYAYIQVGPDLVISSLSAPSGGGAGAALLVTDTTRNQGGGSADVSTTRFYLSTNSTLDAGDAVLGSRSVPALAAGATSTASTSLVVPSETPTGSYYILAKADADNGIAETSETNNNTQYAFIQVGPDLVVSALSAPATGGAGAAISLTDTTKNQGAGAAAASATKFYLSTNTTLDAADVLLGGRSIPPLAAGTASTASTSVTIPAGTTAGTYYIIGKADADAVVAEVNENNNDTQNVSVLIGPDLVVPSLAVRSTGGATISITDTTKNQGGGLADASTTRFYLSTDTVLDASDVLLGSRTIAALSAGAASSASTSATIPAGTAPGSYYIIAKADADNIITETSEVNNTQNAYLQLGPDLVISALYAPSTGGAGSTLSVSDSTLNQGNNAAAPSTTKFYLSVDYLLDATDVLLGSRAVPSLSAGATSSGSTPLTIPAGTATGSYYILAKADADNVVPETNESNNNTQYTYVRIGPDLAVPALSAPSSSGAGLTVNITDTTMNQGGGAADPSVTKFYFSTNSTLDAGDVLLGSRAVPSLGASTSSSAFTSVTIPSGIGPGLYYIIAKADAEGTVVETSEVNNTQYVFIQIGPDLMINSLTAPSTAAAGSTISINDTTRNQGGGPADGSTTKFYLSTNTTLDASDILLGSRSVPLLDPGASNAASTIVTIPAGTVPGVYYIIAKADADGVVAETSESNNTQYVFVQITVN